VRPIDGVRVLDLTRLLPGAYATLLLADLGAEVIKIEDPRGGDTMRLLPTKPPHRNYFERLNRNKRSVTLDLRRPEAADILDALLADADVIVDSFRPSTSRRLGVDAATLRPRYPRLISASITGFGQRGPYAERAAHDINYQALAGSLARGSTSPPRAEGAALVLSASEVEPRTARPLVGKPRMPGPLVGDVGAAMHAAIGILAALFERERTGEGSTVDISIHDAALAWAMLPSTADIENACYTLYETADGEYLALGALEPKFWRGFCERLGRADLVPLQHARGADRGRIAADLRAIVRARTLSEWLETFEGADVCLTRVNRFDEALADPHAAARGVVSRVDDVTYIVPPGTVVQPAPALGADTDAVLERAGMDAAARARLRADGVI
jgi:crotonobetainyl-CoA:carnitine CoA-transferase CaiB-like acyl-CoA transferase